MVELGLDYSDYFEDIMIEKRRAGLTVESPVITPQQFNQTGNGTIFASNITSKKHSI